MDSLGLLICYTGHVYENQAFERNSVTQIYDFNTFGLSESTIQESLGIVQNLTVADSVVFLNVPHCDNDSFILTWIYR